MKTDFYVYIYFDLSGVPRYVGKGSGDRWRAHVRKRTKHKNKQLRALILAHGAELPCVKVRECMSEADAFELEEILIGIIGRVAFGGTLFNLTDGGEGASGAICSEHLREQIASKLRGVKHTPERRLNQSLAHRGKKHSAEQREKIRAAVLAAKFRHTPESRAKISVANRGRVLPPISEETRRKLSEAGRGHTISQETREKISAAKTGKKRPPFTAEHRAKTSATLRGRTLSNEHKENLRKAALRRR